MSNSKQNLSFIKQGHSLYWTKSIFNFSFHIKHKLAEGDSNFNISTYITRYVGLLVGGNLSVEISAI
jgi:hypothetical protein